MTLLIYRHTYRYEIENICRLFLPQEKIKVLFPLDEATVGTSPSCEDIDGVVATTILQKNVTDTLVRCELRLDDFEQSREYRIANDHPEYADECELRMAEILYELFVQLFGFTQKWGIVTGVRPVKLLRRLIHESGEKSAVRWFQDRLLVSPEKQKLSLQTLRAEDEILALSRPDSFSLYVSIPFCPTRCDYCSFVSQTVERAAKLIPQYVELLAKEIARTGQIAAQLGLRLETVYFGGGTPTTLSADQLTTLFQAVEQNFDFSHLREYTVEAGTTGYRNKREAARIAGSGRFSRKHQSPNPA